MKIRVGQYKRLKTAGWLDGSVDKGKNEVGKQIEQLTSEG